MAHLAHNRHTKDYRLISRIKFMISKTELDLPGFIKNFFEIFRRKSFRNEDFRSYLNKPASARSNDEAAIVDSVIVAQILELLGFAEGDRIYNLQHKNNRPDFAPFDSVYGTCFIVEDKNTSLDLDLDLFNADSHLSQLIRYVKTEGIRLGLLTNGRHLTAWSFADFDNPQKFIDIEILTALKEWETSGENLDDNSEIYKILYDLREMFHKDSFSIDSRLETEIALDLVEWEKQALKLGAKDENEEILVKSVQSVILELQRDARRTLDTHLDYFAIYEKLSNQIADDNLESAEKLIDAQRKKFLTEFSNVKNAFGLDDGEYKTIEGILIKFEKDAKAFISYKDLAKQILNVINLAHSRLQEKQSKKLKLYKSLEEIKQLHQALELYSNLVFTLHQRRANLRQKYRTDIAVHDDYTIWAALVQETMLGELDDNKRRDEFALQAVYVVFIRLLLIRVCEDKGIFPFRFLSDGGIKDWQKNIERYLRFANGNPYSHLLDMAYQNAQNIYAHFFTGRELFNWYQLDKKHLLTVLHRLSRFNFAEVDSDIIGTIYSTYLTRKEKKEKGQFYTPPEIVEYILDEVGYKADGGIIGANKRLIDPACGSGKFLVKAAKRLVEAYKKSDDDPNAILDKVKNSLYGFDLNPFACYLTEVNLLIQVLDLVKMAHERGVMPKLERFHVYNVDALARPQGKHRFALFNTLLAEENDIVDEIKSKAEGTQYHSGFAFVVGNPPYGAKISDLYKDILKSEWKDIFHGKPDTYVFFFKFGLELLGTNGKLGFITPNTFLMGTNTANLRREMLNTGRIVQIVDLPQGIWAEATVDCVLLFLEKEIDAERRRNNQVAVKIMSQKENLNNLTERVWQEELTQPQSEWISHPRFEFNIRFDNFIQQIENACVVNNNGQREVLRLGNVTDSSQGIIPYKTKEDGKTNLYIKPKGDIPQDEIGWKPLIDGNSFLRRYELRLSDTEYFIKYGNWLWNSRESKYFDSPKILFYRLMNRSVKRRLVATYDDKKFYNRHNLSNIIAKDNNYDLKYILALFNSSLMNYWYSRQYIDVEIAIADIRQLPIFPADTETQEKIVELVDAILTENEKINQLRAEGYEIKYKRDGIPEIEIPFDKLLVEVQKANPHFPVLDLYDAKASGKFEIPSKCDLSATVSSNIFIAKKHPASVVLRNNQLWFDVEDKRIRQYFLHYLKSPQFTHRTWDEIKTKAFVPENEKALDEFFAVKEKKYLEISEILKSIADLDNQIDEQVFNLYGITAEEDKLRVLNNAALTETDEETAV